LADAGVDTFQITQDNYTDGKNPTFKPSMLLDLEGGCVVEQNIPVILGGAVLTGSLYDLAVVR
jgi:hypothetical protein